jgi:TolB protein
LEAVFATAVDVAPGGGLVFSASAGLSLAHGKSLEIYSSASNGSRVHRLTRNHLFESDPVFSPDGTRIAFSRRIHGRGQIFTMRIDGSEVRRVTHDGRRDRSPSWAPGGHRIVYVSQPAGPEGFRSREIYSIAVSGRDPRQLTADRQPKSDPVYSPDGRWIAFVRMSALWVMRAGGASPHQILAPGQPPGFEGGIDWAP